MDCAHFRIFFFCLYITLVSINICSRCACVAVPRSFDLVYWVLRLLLYTFTNLENYLMDLAHFWICSCLYIIITVRKAALRSLNYFCAFSVFWVGHRNIYKRVHPTCIPTLVLMKLLDGFDSCLDILLFTHCSNCTQSVVSLH